MSIEASNAVWKFSNSRGASRLVMLCIANHINKDGIAWPTIETIAEYTAVSERQVTRSIAQLEADGEIEIVEKGDGRGRSTVYRLTLKGDTVSPFRETGDIEKGDTMSTKGDISSTKGDMVSVKGDTMSPQSLEPLNNHNESLDPTQQVSDYFCELFAVQPGKSNWDIFWKTPISVWLKDSTPESVMDRMKQAHRVAMGGNESGKIYSIPTPKSLMSIMATLKYSNGNGYHNGNGHEIWKKIKDAVTFNKIGELSEAEKKALRSVGGISTIKALTPFDEPKVRASFIQALGATA